MSFIVFSAAHVRIDRRGHGRRRRRCVRWNNFEAGDERCAGNGVGGELAGCHGDRGS